MAVVRITSFTRVKAAIKRTVHYIIHREGRDGEKLTRELFDFTEKRNKAYGYQLMHDAPKGTVFFRFMISPAPKREDRLRDLDLIALTRKTFFTLEEQLKTQIQFVAAIHDDHTPKRHIHAIVLSQARIDVSVLTALIEAATQEAGRQRRLYDLFYRLQQTGRLASRARLLNLNRERERGQSEHRHIRIRGVRRPRIHCPTCNRIHAMYRMRDGTYWCPNYKTVRAQQIAMSR
jgi:hypothetical protein